MLPDGTVSPMMALSKDAALTPIDLREAIALTCLTNLGADATPPDWLEGQLEGMLIDFQRWPGGPWESVSNASFEDVQAATMLRVSA